MKDWGTIKNVAHKTCLEGNTHRLADVGNRGHRPRYEKLPGNSLEGFTSTFTYRKIAPACAYIHA